MHHGKGGMEKWWVPGDWNAFFGFGTNILVNVLVLTGLLRFVLKMPDRWCSRILPARLMLFSARSTTWLAHRLRRRLPQRRLRFAVGHQRAAHVRCHSSSCCRSAQNQRSDPGPGGLTWVFVQSFCLMAGGFIAPIIRDHPRAPRSARSPAFHHLISMRPGLLAFETPLIGMVCFHHPGKLVRRRALLP
jgi:AGZA family xanthine/uracil permease-like MFS transporter